MKFTDNPLHLSKFISSFRSQPKSYPLSYIFPALIRKIEPSIIWIPRRMCYRISPNATCFVSVSRSIYSKLWFFQVVMYACESWTIKKAEGNWTDAFELWCWRRLLRVPWTARRLNQLILNEINPECSLEGLMLKLQYFCHLMWRADSFEKTLMLERLKAGGEGDDRGWDGWMASSIQWTWVLENSGT